MEWNDPANDYRPIYVMGRPMTLTTLLVISYCVLMLACTLTTAANFNATLGWFTFSSEKIWQGQVWRLLTYEFINMPSLSFVVGMFMLYWFGKDVEKFVGRRAFLILFFSLIIIPGVVLGIIGFAIPLAFWGPSFALLGIFVAFATIYPNAAIFFRILAKYIAYIILAIYSLQFLAYHLWIQMGILWLDVAIAHCGMRFLGVQGGFPWWSQWVAERRHSRLMRQTQLRIVREQETEQSLDDILAKISKEGMKSLTSREKETLEKTRKALLEKEKRG